MSYNLPPKGDVKRLPKWAQEYISGLEREIENQDQHIAEISNQHPGSNVVLDTKHVRPDVSLPPDSSVRFYMTASRDLDDAIEIRHNRQRSEWLDVIAYGGSIQIRPNSGNAIRLRIGEY